MSTRLVSRVVAVPVAVPVLSSAYVSYTAGDAFRTEQRLRKTEELLAQVVALQRQNAFLLQSFRGQEFKMESKLGTKAHAVLQAKCIVCHGKTDPKGGFQFGDKLTAAAKLRIYTQVITKKMPPEPREPLTQEQLQDLTNYVFENPSEILDLAKGAKK